MNNDTIIHSYTRAEALADGVLIDITPFAQEARLRFPLALTRAVWESCVDLRGSNTQEHEEARLREIVRVLFESIRAGARGNVVHMSVYFLTDEQQLMEVALKVICGPGDDLEPVLTIMLPTED